MCSMYEVHQVTHIIFPTAISTPNGNCSTGDLRLAGGSDNLQQATREGRVEICINNAWGTVCNTLFRREDAEVVCGQLGGFQRDGILAEYIGFILCQNPKGLVCVYIAGAVALFDAQFSTSVIPIFLDQVVCSGTETSLMNCSRRTVLGLPTCDHSQDVGVRCTGKASTFHDS